MDKIRDAGEAWKQTQSYPLGCQMRGVSELISRHGPAISNCAETKSLNALSSARLLSLVDNKNGTTSLS